MLLKRKLLFGLCLFLCPTVTWAAGGMDDFEIAHVLSIGAGISSPSVTSALVENPAGLVYNQQTKFLGETAATNASLNPIGLGGLFFLGNGFVGGGLGVQTFSGQGNNAGNISIFNFGIAAKATGLNVSIGATGSYVISQSGNATAYANGTTLDSNIGMIFNPDGDVRFGVTAFDVLNGVDALGAGIAASASDWATFSLDGSMDAKSGNGKTIKPAMGIHLMDFQFTLGYGLGLDNLDTNWIRRGTAFGMGIQLGMEAHLQFYYNQLALYFVGLTIRL